MAVTYEDVEIEVLGHASVRIAAGDDTVIYVDPWSEQLEDRPGDGELVVITHDDHDHYDPDGIDAVAAPDATVAAFEAVDTSGVDHEVVDLPETGRTTVSGVAIESIPSHNDPAGKHVDDAGEPFHAPGEVIGVLFDLDGVTVYLPSDTDFLDHHDGIRADVFVPPIGGHYTMDRHEAAAFARSVEPDLVVPIHYDTFEPIETDAAAFAAELEDDGIEVALEG